MRVWLMAAVLMVGAGAYGQLVPPPTPGASGSAAPLVGENLKPLRFEIVSIKVNKSGSLNTYWAMKPDGMSMTGMTLDNLVKSAYDLFSSTHDCIVGLPKWAATERFDIEARVAPEDVERYQRATGEQGHEILRALLEDRFALKAKPVINERPVYALVVAKGGPKFTASKEVIGPNGSPVRRAGMSINGGSIKVTDGDLSTLVINLMYAAGRTVIDKTGLTGKYDYTLKWTPDETADAGADSGKAAAPPVFTALQEQLGLRLDPTRGPVKGLVVEHLEMPSAN